MCDPRLCDAVAVCYAVAVAISLDASRVSCNDVGVLHAVERHVLVADDLVVRADAEVAGLEHESLVLDVLDRE